MAGMFDDLIPQQAAPSAPNQGGALPQGQGLSFDDLIPKAAPQWSDLPSNVLPSAKNFAGGMVNTVLHPGDTAENIIRSINGGIHNGVSAINPDWGARFAAFDTDSAQDIPMASALGNAMKARYGSADAFKNTMITDPVGFLGDASALLTGGGTAAERVAADSASMLGRIGTGLKTAGEVSNPLSAVSKPASLVAQQPFAQNALSELIGLPSGVGGDSVKEAFGTGMNGGSQGQAFRDNMRGNVPQTNVLQDADTALGNMADARSKSYTSGMQATNANPATMSYAPIDSAMQNLTDSLYHGPSQVTDDASIGLAKKVGDSINEWQQNFPNPTAQDLDRLKVKIDNLNPNFSQTTGQQGRIVTTMRNAVKDQIVANDPTYANTMGDYEQSKNLQNEIQRTLSLGPNATDDAGVRKLQSVFRNNANTNYGGRVANAQALQDAGAPNLMASLAGQTFNSMAPRGLAKLLSGSELATAMVHPALATTLLPALAASSPRLMGELLHGSGQMIGSAGQMVGGGLNAKALAAALAGNSVQSQGN